MLVFGPVPSRRLGQSLGINHIPPKACPYSCVYCQIGRTNHMSIKRCEFYMPEEIFAQTKQKLSDIDGKRVDYLTFVPDGEPTLDIHLGQHIDILKPFGIKIAVITNASLLWMDDVKEDLLKADWVSVKIDAVNQDIWQKIDRPHGSLKLDVILQGMMDFAREYKGTLVTETMLVHGFNDHKTHISEIAECISRIQPEKAYFLVPTRPPAEANVYKPTEESLRNAYDIFRQNGLTVECIAGDEGDNFYFSDDFANDLLSITAVHPVKEDVVFDLLRRRGLDGSVIDQLVSKQMISSYEYEGKRFYKRNL
ncbi:MAG TPA: radical SAM protein [Candidatus Limiplasma sp.]|nr:radical SAM protein [Candidatus Limiplasma sp.]